MTFVVGLTGGIGSGKTVVSDYFAKLGVPVIDTDVVARAIVEPDMPALNQLVKEFGQHILLENGELDRAALRTLAFSSPVNKARLDDITHPAIRVETFAQLEACEYPYCIVVVPLLTAGSAFAELMQRILVVTAKRDTRIARVMERSKLSTAEVERIMATQLSDEQRLEFADDVIANDTSIKDVHDNVETLHQLYLTLSSGDVT